ncbi:MAG: shikimate dehydrogenase [Chloroflexi bacterium]|nr:MAG: shikimate dehydrogenase [Chloroflexota bacterium]
MNRFAFIIHPIDPKKDVQRKFPLLGKLLPVAAINFFSRYFPPVYISHITGVRSEATGEEIEGWFVACPFTPQRMMTLPPPVVYKKIIQTGRLAERLGAQILGLGAFTSVVGDAGLTISKSLRIPVTTGDSYTVYVAVEAARQAARRMGIALDQAVAAVVGATGAIGSVCARLLSREVPQMILIGRRQNRLEALRRQIEAETDAEVRTTTDLSALRQADVVITVTSAIETIIEPHHLKSGAVVCDVARPRDVSRRVVEVRDDVLVIEGGMVKVPGPVDFHFDFGFPPDKAYACMAETMVLALEGRFESFTLGKEIQIEKVKEIGRLAEKHGFRVEGFRSFERPVTEEEIERIRTKAQRTGG